MSANRAPAVAGRFYPGDPLELRGLIQDLLAQSPGHPLPAAAAVVPHAGLPYSGRCAARVFRRITLTGTVVILAPNHTGYGAPDRAGVWPAGGFETPLGTVPVDDEFAAVLVSHSDLVVEDPDAHRFEHAIEVELPFLQILAPDVRIVPIVVPWARWDRCGALAALLADLLAAEREKEILVLASSDMTHYTTATHAAEQDAMALDRVRVLDGAGLLDVCDEHRITMCGRGPAAVAVEVARRRGASGAVVIDYCHSGEVTGDLDSVVAYAGVIAA